MSNKLSNKLNRAISVGILAMGMALSACTSSSNSPNASIGTDHAQGQSNPASASSNGDSNQSHGQTTPTQGTPSSSSGKTSKGDLSGSTELKTCFNAHPISEAQLENFPRVANVNTPGLFEAPDRSLYLYLENIIYYTKDLVKFELFSFDQGINTLKVDDHGKIYIGHQYGLSVSEGFGKPFTAVNGNKGIGFISDTPQLSDRTVNDIQFGPNFEIILGTGAGISISKDGGKSFSNHTFFNKIPGKSSGTVSWNVQRIFVDSNGFIFTLYNQQIVKTSLSNPDQWSFWNPENLSVIKNRGYVSDLTMIGDKALMAVTQWGDASNISENSGILVSILPDGPNQFLTPAKDGLKDAVKALSIDFSKRIYASFWSSVAESIDGGTTFQELDLPKLPWNYTNAGIKLYPGLDGSKRLFALPFEVAEGTPVFVWFDRYQAKSCDY